MSWKDIYKARKVGPEAAAARIRSGARVFMSGNAGAPQALTRALCQRHEELERVEIVSLLTLGEAPWAAPEMARAFRSNALFVGENLRESVAAGRADYTPVFLSEIPRLFRERMPLDAALVMVSPPDEHGYCSLGVSVDVALGAARQARQVIAEVNPHCPRTLGDCFLHVSQLAALVEVDYPLPELPDCPAPDEVTLKIAGHVAGLVEDGDTLQLGIGSIPDAVLHALADRRELGIHTEMFSDGVMRLVEAGVITGERKPLHRGKVVSSFLAGSRELYRWAHDNAVVEMHPSEYVNDPWVVAQHDRVVAVNSALSVDLSGQVCADSLGSRIYSGIGGQVDFVRGAARAAHGRPVIALPSTAKGGAVSRIVPELALGSGVVTSRGDVRLVVTEYGVADLWGKCLRERARALTAIAHPAFREGLERAARERRLLAE